VSGREIASRPSALPGEGTRAANDGASPLEARLYGLAREGHGTVGEGLVLLPDALPANDEHTLDADALLDADPAFAALCDARREQWIESMEHASAHEAPQAEGRNHDGT
jgi:hypothetical protein